MAISSADRYTCALRLDGTPICWGEEGNDRFLSDFKALVSPLEDEQFTAISSNDSKSCGLRRNGTVVCWSAYDFESWQQPPADERFTAISTGGSYTCAIRTDGKAACWGTQIDYRIMDLPPTVERVDTLSSGDDHTCAVLDDVSLHCWIPEVRFVANRGEAQPPESGQFKAVSMADGYGCALRLDGSPVCWGLDQYDPSTVDGGRTWGDDFGQNVPPQGTFTEISAGRLHACALQEDGTPVCWGIDTHRVEYGPFTAITSGAYRTCGISLQGSPVCWGPKSDRLKAVKVAAITNGDDHYSPRAYGLRDDGSLVRLDYLMGYFPSPPRDPPESHKFRTVAGGGEYICGIRDDNAAY